MESREQDKELMDLIEAMIRDRGNEEGTGIGVLRVHDRSMKVEFPDGREVTLVLYGPRGK